MSVLTTEKRTRSVQTSIKITSILFILIIVIVRISCQSEVFVIFQVQVLLFPP
jgi:hypothetical protein